MQVVHEIYAILDECPVDHCCMDGHVWSPFGRSITAYRTWADDRVSAINIHCHAHIGGQLFMTQVTEATSKTELSRKTFLTPVWRPLKISPKETHANFHADQREIYVYILSLRKNTYNFLIGDSPECHCPMLHILESSRRADFKL